MGIGRLGTDMSVIWMVTALISSISLWLAFSRHARAPLHWPGGIAHLTLVAWTVALVVFAVAFILFVPLSGHPSADQSTRAPWSLWVILYLSLLISVSVALVVLFVSFCVSWQPAGCLALFIARIQVLVFLAVTLVAVLTNIPGFRVPDASSRTALAVINEVAAPWYATRQDCCAGVETRQ